MTITAWTCVVCKCELPLEDVYVISHGKISTLNLRPMCEPCCDAELVKQKGDVSERHEKTKTTSESIEDPSSPAVRVSSKDSRSSLDPGPH